MQAASVHDYRHLMSRWRDVARRAGLSWRRIAVADGFPLFAVSSPALRKSGGIYISAGIHGDEPGATEGLVLWAGRHAASLSGLPLLVFPCLNPWGLVHNTRSDASGNDLNRVWKSPNSVAVRAVVARIAGHRFRLALTLHEDYDGRGLYLYEPGAAKFRDGMGELLIGAARHIIPPDPRATIDGRRACGGLIRPRLNKTVLDSQPEAVFLHLHHADRSFTFETPSEFAIETRAHAHAALLEKSIRLTMNPRGKFKKIDGALE